MAAPVAEPALPWANGAAGISSTDANIALPMGSRIEVKWEVEETVTPEEQPAANGSNESETNKQQDPATGVDQKPASAEENPPEERKAGDAVTEGTTTDEATVTKTFTRWWGATVIEIAQDRNVQNRTEYQIRYDTAEGFPDEEIRVVLFIDEKNLWDLELGTEMRWRIEGQDGGEESDAEEEEGEAAGEGEEEEEADNNGPHTVTPSKLPLHMASIFHNLAMRHHDKLSNLTPYHERLLAEGLENITSALTEHMRKRHQEEGGEVMVTAEDVREAMQNVKRPRVE